MSEYGSVDEPRPMTKDRPVAGRHTNNGRHAGESRDEEPLVGEVVSERGGEGPAGAGVGWYGENDRKTGSDVAMEPPGTERGDETESVLDQQVAERFRDRWQEVKAIFVDDPPGAVRQAGALSGEVVEELTAALGRLRKNLDGRWNDGEETDTENLRVALRGYGSLIERVLEH